MSLALYLARVRSSEVLDVTSLVGMGDDPATQSHELWQGEIILCIVHTPAANAEACLGAAGQAVIDGGQFSELGFVHRAGWL